MPKKFDIDGWERDKARRADRLALGLCPMCGKPKRAEDEFCGQPCKDACARGAASQE